MSKQPSYGVHKYNTRQLNFHKDIMDVLHKKEHREISADECMIVFGRCYSIYVASQLELEDKIDFK